MKRYIATLAIFLSIGYSNSMRSDFFNTLGSLFRTIIGLVKPQIPQKSSYQKLLEWRIGAIHDQATCGEVIDQISKSIKDHEASVMINQPMLNQTTFWQRFLFPNYPNYVTPKSMQRLRDGIEEEKQQLCEIRKIGKDRDFLP